MGAGTISVRNVEITDTLVRGIACICHNANREFALLSGEDPATVHPTFHAAPVEIQESSIAGVHAALRGEGPEELHQSWMMKKLNDGWKFGQVRNNAAKMHPCLVPYGDLPEAQQRKDALFLGIVEAIAGPVR